MISKELKIIDFEHALKIGDTVVSLVAKISGRAYENNNEEFNIIFIDNGEVKNLKISPNFILEAVKDNTDVKI